MRHVSHSGCVLQGGHCSSLVLASILRPSVSSSRFFFPFPFFSRSARPNIIFKRRGTPRSYYSRTQRLFSELSLVATCISLTLCPGTPCWGPESPWPVLQVSESPCVNRMALKSLCAVFFSFFACALGGTSPAAFASSFAQTSSAVNNAPNMFADNGNEAEFIAGNGAGKIASGDLLGFSFNFEGNSPLVVTDVIFTAEVRSQV